ALFPKHVCVVAAGRARIPDPDFSWWPSHRGCVADQFNRGSPETFPVELAEIGNPSDACRINYHAGGWFVHRSVCGGESYAVGKWRREELFGGHAPDGAGGGRQERGCTQSECRTSRKRVSH